MAAAAAFSSSNLSHHHTWPSKAQRPNFNFETRANLKINQTLHPVCDIFCLSEQLYYTTWMFKSWPLQCDPVRPWASFSTLTMKSLYKWSLPLWKLLLATSEVKHKHGTVISWRPHPFSHANCFLQTIQTQSLHTNLFFSIILVATLNFSQFSSQHTTYVLLVCMGPLWWCLAVEIRK